MMNSYTPFSIQFPPKRFIKNGPSWSWNLHTPNKFDGIVAKLSEWVDFLNSIKFSRPLLGSLWLTAGCSRPCLWRSLFSRSLRSIKGPKHGGLLFQKGSGVKPKKICLQRNSNHIQIKIILWDRAQQYSHQLREKQFSGRFMCNPKPTHKPEHICIKIRISSSTENSF